MKGTAVEAVEREGRAEVGDNSGTKEKPGNGDRPCSSDEFTSDAIQNPSIRPIQTASEWDPGPSKSASNPTLDESKDLQAVQGSADGNIQNLQESVVRTIAHEPVHPVAEFLWPPGDRIGQAHHYLIRSISTRNTSVRKHRLLSRSLTKRAAGIGYTSRGNGGSISDNWGKFTQVAAETRTSDCAQNTTSYALYFRKSRRALRGEIQGRKVWDPGGGRAESSILAGRCGKRRGKQGQREYARGEQVGSAC